MSFLGKVLIVAQVVLSVLFMCAAGAVFSIQKNWKEQSATLTANIDTAQQQHTDEVASLNQEIDNLKLSEENEKGRADAEVGRSQQLDQQVAALTQETNSLNQQLQRQTGLTVSTSNEAEFRQEEAELLRVALEELSDTLDQKIAETVALEDTLSTERQAHAELVALSEEQQEQIAFLERIVRAEGFETDRRAVASLAEPPPKVEAIVKDIRKDQTNRTKFVHITTGSDDGLRIGHELDVYRTADRNQGRTKYLGRIRLTLVTSDEAVGLVVKAAKNGIIEVGDNVTTQL